MASVLYYSRLGAKYGFFGLLLGGALYVLLVLRPWKKRSLDRETKLKWFLSLWYLSSLLFLTLLMRSPSEQTPNFRLFDTLRRALSDPGFFEWNLLILNVAAFVPLGLLVSWHARGREKPRRLYWMLFLVPLLVELAQFLTGLGKPDVDDVVLNVLGGLWGYCLGLLFEAIERKRPAGRLAFLSALPLLVIASVLLWFIARPCGFIPQDFTAPRSERPRSVDVRALEAELPAAVTVYRRRGPSENEAEPTADRLFAALGLKRENDSADRYDDPAVFRAEGFDTCLWYYDDGSFVLRIPDGLPLNGTPLETAMAVLERARFRLPAPSETEEGRAVWDFVPADSLLYDGELCVTVSPDALTEIELRLSVLQPGTEYRALDARALRTALRSGCFRIEKGPKNKAAESLVCQSASVGWIIDSKGCSHPVYRIACLLDGVPGVITAPAFWG